MATLAVCPRTPSHPRGCVRRRARLARAAALSRVARPGRVAWFLLGWCSVCVRATVDAGAAGSTVSLAETLHESQPHGADGSPPDQGSTDYVEATGARTNTRTHRAGCPRAPPDRDAAAAGCEWSLIGREHWPVSGDEGRTDWERDSCHRWTGRGTINLRENLLTIGPSANISAEILAKSVIVLGRQRGNITWTEKIEIRENGSVEGDISAPRVAIAEGGHFRGSIDMQQADQLPGGPRARASAGPRADAAPRVTRGGSVSTASARPTSS